MSSSDTVTETLDEGGNGIAGRVTSLSESVAPALARQAESGTLAAASGVVSLVRAGRTFLKGNRKKGALQALAGLFWVAVALAQRRSGSAEESRSGSDFDSTERGTDFGDVVDSSADIGEVETDDTATDHATGEAVVDTTDADETTQAEPDGGTETDEK
ncbi:hypothetical protein [Halorussus lipolyticus]|uniref:hypothetical protein n=1 Tax=Halorussus lipolyticus TaxID=3034024 RepID=UPI0023E8E586|nr:hypothetical protein [Halorussus sp. DT80]